MSPTLCRSIRPAAGYGDPSPSVPISDGEPPLGVVAFTTHRGERAEAILDADGTWHCPQLPVLDRVLNALYAPSWEDEPDDSFGRAQLRRAAAWLKGSVVGRGQTGHRAGDGGADRR